MMWRFDGGSICPFCGSGGNWGAGGLLMMFFGLLVLAGIVLLVIWAFRQAGHHDYGRGTYSPGGPGRGPNEYPRPPQMPPSEDAAVAAARHRYATGEITKEELDEILTNLSAPR